METEELKEEIKNGKILYSSIKIDKEYIVYYFDLDEVGKQKLDKKYLKVDVK